MNRTRQLSIALRPLAGGLVLLALAAAASAQSEEPSREPAEERSALVAKRPAKLKRPPPELSPSASSVRQAFVRQTAQAEELPRVTRPAEPARIVQPQIVQPQIVAPEVAIPEYPAQDYIMLDEGAYGADYGGMASEPNRGRFFGRVEYLLWWTEGFNTPPLITTSSAGTAQADAGILGLPTTTVLLGGDSLLDPMRHGLRATAGVWIDRYATTGIQASAFGLLTEDTSFSADSATFPILARPFFNVEPGFEGPDAELIAYPGLFVGQIDVEAESRLFGGEIFARHRLCKDCLLRVDALGGFRYAQLDDRLQISDSRTVVGPGAGVAIGTTFSEIDVFETRNQFYGGELGFIAELHRCPFFVEASLKLALGVNQSRTQIAGQSTATVPVPGGPPVVVVTPAGLLAQSTNIGTYVDDDDFAVIPEVGLTVGYDITPRLRVVAGYTFMYWTGVVRAGDQIDATLNLSQLAPGGLVGAPRPEFRRVTDDMWVQGLSVGLDFRF
jgi:hypothetical protein